MANRRAIGDAISKGGSSMIDLYIRNFFAQKQAEQEDQRLRERQIADDERQAKMTGEGRTASAEAAKLAAQRQLSPQVLERAGISMLDGIPTSARKPSIDELLGPQYKRLNDASSLAQLPGEQSMLGEIRAAGGATEEPTASVREGFQAPMGLPEPIQRLMAARQEQQDTLRGQRPTTPITQPNPQTLGMETTHVPNDELASMGPIPTGMTPQQQGEADLKKFRAGEGSAGYNLTKIQNETEQNLGTAPSAAVKAGKVAGAEASARADADLTKMLDPRRIAAEIEMMKQKAIIEASAAGEREAAQAAMKAADSSRIAAIALSELKVLYDRVKVGRSFGDMFTRAGRAAGHATGTLGMSDPVSSELDTKADAWPMLVYRAYGGTAAQMSDKDMAAVQKGIPRSTMIKEVGDAVFITSSMMLRFNPMIVKRYGTQPFEFQMQVFDKWKEMNDTARERGVDEFQDPYSPNLPPIKVIR